MPRDVRDIDDEVISGSPHWDVVACGWPCQGLSRANRRAKGLRDPRTHVFLDVVRIIDKLRSHQIGGVGYLLENVSTMGDKRPAVLEAEAYIKHCLGEEFTMDAVRVGSHFHRVRRYWTNLCSPAGLHEMLHKTPQTVKVLNDVLPSHLRARPAASIPVPPGGVALRGPNGEAVALPTLVSVQQSDSYKPGGPGRLYNKHTKEWIIPPLAVKEQLMGYVPGEALPGDDMPAEAEGELTLTQHAELLGQAMDMHAMAWLWGAILLEQSRKRNTLAAMGMAACARRETRYAEEAKRERRRAMVNAILMMYWLSAIMHIGVLLGVAATMTAAAVVATRDPVGGLSYHLRHVFSAGRGCGPFMSRWALGANAVSEGPGGHWANEAWQGAPPDSGIVKEPSLRQQGHEWQIGQKRTAEQRQQLVDLCEKDSTWDSLWCWTAKQLHAVRGFEFCIPTTNVSPIHRRKYRLSRYEWDFVDQWCAELLEAGAIRESQSSYAIPVVCPPKKDDDGHWTGIRVCLDARPLNAVTEPFAYPMPKVDELLAAMGQAQLFSTADIKSAFHTLPIAEEDRHKTAFWSSNKLYEWTRMPMGLKNASQAWQAVMEDCLKGLPFVAVYIDDICIFSGRPGMTEEEIFAEHLDHLRQVFDRLAVARIGVSPGKLKLACEAVAFLGHWVGREGVYPQWDKVAAVKNMEPPKDVPTLRRFLGMVNYYGKFCEGMARPRKVLSRLTGKVPWQWGDAEQVAFERLKALLCQSPVLKRPDWNRPFILHTDFSSTGLGAVLTQEDDEGREYVIEFASRACQGAEADYPSFEGECLAALWAMDHFRYYLHGRQFVLVSDNKPNEYLMSCGQLRGKMARWAMRLSEYDYTFRYREGSKNVVPDCLSRDPSLQRVDGSIRDAACAALADYSVERQLTALTASTLVQTAAVTAGEKLKGSVIDPWLVPDMLQRLREGRSRANIQKFSWLNDRLWRRHADGGWREVPPPERRAAILQDVHLKLSHAGRDKLFSVIAASYWWPGYYADALAAVKTCPYCDREKARPKFNQGQPIQASPLDLKPLPHYGLMFRWHIDFAGPFEESRDRNRYVLVMVEAASKWVELVALPAKEPRLVRRAFMERVLARFAAPAEVCSDGGSEFKGEFQELLEEFDIERRTTAPYHPGANGMAERLVAYTKDNLRKFAVEKGRVTWDDHLPAIEMGYRLSKQASTKYSPYELMYGRPPVWPAQARAMFEDCMVDFDDPAGVWLLMTERAEVLAHMVPAALNNIEVAQRRDVMRFRRRRAGMVPPGLPRFSIGDYVYVQQAPQDALDPRVRARVYRLTGLHADGGAEVQGSTGEVARVRVEELAPCALPFLTIPAGFEDPDLACVHCGDKVSHKGNRIVICEECEKGWHQRCLQPVMRRVPRGAWFCAGCQSGNGQRRIASASLARFTRGLDCTRDEVLLRLINDMPGDWHKSTVTRVTKELLKARSTDVACIATAVSEYQPLRDVLNWRHMLVVDPWAGSGATATALEPWGACVITSDINVQHDCHLCGDALADVTFHRAWELGEDSAPGRVRCVVSSPWFALLDLAIPHMVRHSDVLCVQVPHGYMVNGPEPRLRWFNDLASSGRLHIVVGAGARNPVVGRRALWLLVFSSRAVRNRLLNPELVQHCATIHWAP